MAMGLTIIEIPLLTRVRQPEIVEAASSFWSGTASLPEFVAVSISSANKPSS
jgi:hypothetical protein